MVCMYKAEVLFFRVSIINICDYELHCQTIVKAY